MDLPSTIEECDRRLENCRKTLVQMQVRKSRELVIRQIDELLDQRTRLAARGPPAERR